ncbi:MAG TPA: RES family NAD+ phosphorylase [Terriglobales bacterium]|nr:RES family NAD+ phosphorylase [Terriglobales bacterium]
MPPTPLPITQIDQRDTHRLIPAQYADDGASVLTRLTDNPETLEGISELDNATNDRLLAESRLAPGIDERELVFGIPSYRIINAAFCHPSPVGARFNSADRGAWYASFELETSQAEVAYHRQLWLTETSWDEEDSADYADYLADFRAEFHDLRGPTGRDWEYAACLSPTSYAASQRLAAHLLELGSAGIVYPSVRHVGGTCIGCFRPVLVTNVRRGDVYTVLFADFRTPPRIYRA